MTASEGGRPGGGKQMLDQALDLFVYAPVGLLVSSLEELTADDLPELAQKGRGRIGRVLSNARVVGSLTVAMGRRSIDSEFARWRMPEPAKRANGHQAEEPGAAPPVGGPIPAEIAETPRRVAETHLAIPGYEALSASQVVRRLDGLAPVELEAIYAHEAATRRRRTILHRTQQLLGHEDAPGPASWPA